MWRTITEGELRHEQQTTEGDRLLNSNAMDAVDRQEPNFTEEQVDLLELY